ncbi:MAG: hypothetical protein ACUVS3_05095 [Thermodesulfobacteriota bacterium]
MLPRDQEAQEGTPILIRGVVVPAGWDVHGRITKVAISSSDEREYEVRGDAFGLKLHSMLHLPVEIKGHLVPDGSGGQEILVSEFWKADLEPW